MANHDLTLKELATPNVVYQLWCVQYPILKVNYELKHGLIHLLRKCHGLASEDPHKHLKEFQVVCCTMRPSTNPKDYVKMTTFAFPLDGTTKVLEKKIHIRRGVE
uniref:Uncharacterized protein n=1 Tax=Cajanus cajan TaxID=3821 RepID=A0A151RGU7_CAJCA|nr:hypothetical protein KK1_036932 [Cajanus cajan]